MIAVALLAAAASAGAQTSGPSAQSGAPAAPTTPATDPSPRRASADTLPNFFRDLQANAFLSLGYISNLNNPSGNANGLRVFDANANTFIIDVAELVVQKPVANKGDAGFRVDLEAGSAIPAKTQSGGLVLGPATDLQQAFVSYIAPVGNGLRLDLGKFVTHLGLELIEGYDGYNDNYSRSLLFNYAIPLTHTGVKGSYAFSSQAAVTVMVVNGWDLAVDNNSSKSVGAQLAITPSAGPVAVYFNYMGGPELPGNNSIVRHVFDVVATWKATDAVSFGLNADYGRDDKSSLVTAGKNAVWKGVAGYSRLGVTDNFSLSLRAETFQDEGGARFNIPVATTVSELTLTPTYKVNKNFIVRAEGRYDSVNQDDFFSDDKGASKRSQATIGVNAIFVF